MRDVLGTIQADQDAIVRAGSRGTLVVDGGPGTGKTVVALHRTAYLLYADPRLGHRRGGVLFVGPHQPYLAYVGDVLPSLGEEGVQTCTVLTWCPRRRDGPEPDDRVADLKADLRMVTAIEPAVALYEEPPTESLPLETAWGDVRLTAAEWAEAFDSPDPGTPHNLARDDVWEEVLTILVDKATDAVEDLSPDELRRVLHRHAGPARHLRPGLAADRAHRPGRRPLDGSGLPAPLRSLAATRRGAGAAPRGRPRRGRTPTSRSSTPPD